MDEKESKSYELELIQKAQNGNKKAINELIESKEKNIQLTLLKLLSGSQFIGYIDDIKQDCMIKICRNINQYKPTYTLNSWISTVVKNHLYDFFRNQKNKPHNHSCQISDQGNDDEETPSLQIPDHSLNPSEIIIHAEWCADPCGSARWGPVLQKVALPERGPSLG